MLFHMLNKVGNGRHLAVARRLYTCCVERRHLGIRTRRINSASWLSTSRTTLMQTTTSGRARTREHITTVSAGALGQPPGKGGGRLERNAELHTYPRFLAHANRELGHKPQARTKRRRARLSGAPGKKPSPSSRLFPGVLLCLHMSPQVLDLDPNLEE